MSLLWYAHSVVAYGIYFPDQGSNAGPLHWESGVLVTEPWGKSQILLLHKEELQNHIAKGIYNNAEVKKIAGEIRIGFSPFFLLFIQQIVIDPSPVSGSL